MLYNKYSMREQINIIEASTRPAKLETTPLPYGENELMPVLSADSINYHYEHLAKGYARRYNAGEGMQILIALVVFYTISFSPNFVHQRVPTAHVVQYWP